MNTIAANEKWRLTGLKGETEALGVTDLARNAAVDVGNVVGQYLKIAQLEVTAELRGLGRRARLVAVLVVLVIVGYALSMAGLAIIIGGGTGMGIPLVIVGLVHVAGAGAGLMWETSRAH